RTASVPHYLRGLSTASPAAGPDLFNSGPWACTHYRKMRRCRLHRDAAVARTYRTRALLCQWFRSGSEGTGRLLRSSLQDWADRQRETGPRKLSEHFVVRFVSHKKHKGHKREFSFVPFVLFVANAFQVRPIYILKSS